MPEDLKLSQIGSSQLPPPLRGLHSPGVRKHCQIIFACYFRKWSIVPRVESSHLPSVLCARAIRADTGHPDSGDEWIERYVWDKQKENDFVAHLSTSSSLDEVTRATMELDVC